jgi:hypothetical protein
LLLQERSVFFILLLSFRCVSAVVELVCVNRDIFIGPKGYEG